MILLFVVGYTFIALEHKVKVDKSAIALLMCGAIWTVFSLWGHDSNISHEMVDHLGDTCEILVFLIGAMTIVDLSTRTAASTSSPTTLPPATSTS